VIFLPFCLLWAVVGIGGIVLAIRKREWPRQARAATLILGISTALPALYLVFVTIYVFGCTRAGNCL
jgi:hypothetical protein